MMSERSPKHSASLRAGRYPQRVNHRIVIGAPTYRCSSREMAR